MPLRREVILGNLNRCCWSSEMGIATVPRVVGIATVEILAIWKGIIHAMRCLDRCREPLADGNTESRGQSLNPYANRNFT